MSSTGTSSSHHPDGIFDGIEREPSSCQCSQWLSRRAGDRQRDHRYFDRDAVVQTFTDELREVKGTAELDVTVVGSIAEPLVEGSLQVRNGAFTVLLAQSGYTGLDTDITFHGDLLRIRDFVLVDDEGSRLRVGGQLPIAERSAAGLEVRIDANNFEVADNRFAELNADAAVLITGTLLQPRIKGRLGLRDSTPDGVLSVVL